MNRKQYKEFQSRYKKILKKYNTDPARRNAQRELLEQLAHEMNLNIISSANNTYAFFSELSERVSMAFDRYETLKASQGAFCAAVAAAIAAIISVVATAIAAIISVVCMFLN